MHRIIKYLLVVSPLLIFWAFNHRNMPLSFSWILAAIAIPFVLRFGGDRGGYRYGLVAVVMGVLLLLVRSNSLFYFSAFFFVLFLLDNIWGRINYLPLLLGIALSPVIGNVVYIWSFPIRLQLSRWAAEALALLGMPIEAVGNVLLVDGHEFSVDPACIGLKLVITSLVLGLVIMGYFEKQYQRSLPFWKSVLLISVVLLLAVISNFIRLLTLILFHILPENFMHDVIGLLCMVVYTLVPFYFLVKTIFAKSGKWKLKSATPKVEPIKPGIWLLTLGLFLLLVWNGRTFLRPDIEDLSAVEKIEIAGLEKEITPNGVLELRNEEVLLYIKPPVRFFQGSHDPRFCWQGSGYTFSNIEMVDLPEASQQPESPKVYTATLKKGDDQLFTAWWYQDATHITPHEWDWRWKALSRQGRYYMVNVSCEEEEALRAWVKRVSSALD